MGKGKQSSKKRSISERNSEQKKEELKKKQKTKQFKNKIRYIFRMSGFEFIDSENHHLKVGHRDIELDAVFLYENILVICEDTGTGKDHIKDHIRNKQEAFEQIKSNVCLFCDKLKSITEKTELIEKYQPEQYKIIYLYCPQEELDFGTEDYARFSKIKFMEPHSLEYLYRISQCIKKSVKYEMLRFLEISDEDIGGSTTEAGQKRIKAAIISPKETTGIYNGVRVVSFMMSAETLIKNSYVLRKDNWEESSVLYQRLIRKEKIKNIREFLVNKGQAFYNNIIVALPDGVYFQDCKGNIKTVQDIDNFDSCTMVIPDCINSICIIDGQHRVYAHYEGDSSDKNEEIISGLRKKLHLLVTGLVFPPDMSKTERMQIQSEIFLDINSKAKPVPPDVILHIQQLKAPLSDIGLARAVIARLNRETLFLKKFEMSSLDEGKIKIASIIKFALRYLVRIDAGEKKSFYDFWGGDKDALLALKDDALDDYISFCTKNLTVYFSAIRKRFLNEWNDKESKLLSVISINGFIIAYNQLLDKEGIKDFEYFDKSFSSLDIDFSKDKFPYTSSQYRRFSDELLEPALLSNNDEDIV